VRYGGSGGYGSVYMYRADVAVRFSEVSGGSSYGIYTRYGTPVLEGNVVEGNGSHGIYHYYGSPVDRDNEVSGNGLNGINVQDAVAEIEGNEITGNGEWGIYYTAGGAASVLVGNTVSGNRRGVMVPASSVPDVGDGNVLGPNRVEGVWIRGNERGSDLGLEVLSGGSGEGAYEINTYQIHGTMRMGVGTVLTVAPGVVVKFADGARLEIDGVLSAVGTEAAPVVFTSWRDDGYGGDLNLDGYGSGPANGDWDGIMFREQAVDDASEIVYGVVRYGGAGNNGMVYTDRTDVEIRESVVTNSSTSGVRGYRADVTLVNDEVYANSGDGVRLEYEGAMGHVVSGSRIYANFGDGIEVTGDAGVEVSGSEIFGNVGYGVRSGSSGDVVVVNNWWGAADGRMWWW